MTAPRLTAAAFRTLREGFDDRPFFEAQTFGWRWALFPFAAVRVGPSSRREMREGGEGVHAASTKRRTPFRILAPARTAAPVEATAEPYGYVRMGSRRFDGDYVRAIEAAFPGCSWRLSAPEPVRAGEADQVAYAYLGGQPVALLAPVLTVQIGRAA